MRKNRLMLIACVGFATLCSAQNPTHYNNANIYQSQLTQPVSCNLCNKHYADDCLTGKNAPATMQKAESCGCSNSASSIAEVNRLHQEAVQCNLNNPQFAEGCLNGKTAQVQRYKNTRVPDYQNYAQTRVDSRYQECNATKQTTNQSNFRGSNTVSYVEYMNRSSKNYYSAPVVRERYQEPSQGVGSRDNWSSYISVPSEFGSPVVKTIQVNPQVANTTQATYSQPVNVQPAPRAERVTQPIVVTRTNNINENPFLKSPISIDGFWGLKFGMEQSSVFSYLMNNNLNQGNILSKTNNAILFQNVNFANVKYDNATLMFQDNLLCGGLFIKSYGNKDEADKETKEIARNLTLKYGNPEVKVADAGTRYYWNDNNTKRTIMVELKPLGANNFYGIDLMYVDRALSKVDSKAAVNTKQAGLSADY